MENWFQLTQRSKMTTIINEILAAKQQAGDYA
jgi:hypothetical protein